MQAVNRSPVPVLVDVGSRRGGCVSGVVVVGKSRGMSRGQLVAHGGEDPLPCATQTVCVVLRDVWDARSRTRLESGPPTTAITRERRLS